MENTNVFRDINLELTLVFSLSVVAGLSLIVSLDREDIRLVFSLGGDKGGILTMIL